MFGRKKGSDQQGTPVNLLESILLVVDGSQPSIAAANFAVDLAAQLASRITAVYVVDTATMDYLLQMRIFVREEREEFEQDLQRTGKRYLDYVTAAGSKAGVSVDTVLLRGRFNTMILQEARNRQVDAIVVGGWRRSVTRKDATSVERQLILDQADCPVLVVKDDEKRRDERG